MVDWVHLCTYGGCRQQADYQWWEDEYDKPVAYTCTPHSKLLCAAHAARNPKFPQTIVYWYDQVAIAGQGMLPEERP